jgi:hypothetical protein
VRAVGDGRGDLLVGVERLVGDLDLAPVAAAFLVPQPLQEGVELGAAVVPSGLQPLGLGLLDPHGDRQHLDGAGRGALHGGCRVDSAADALGAHGEAVDQDVGQEDGADAGGVTDTGTAVDQDVVVGGDQLLAQGLQEEPAAVPVVEAVPVEAGDSVVVGGRLSPGGQEVQPAAGGQLQQQADGVGGRVRGGPKPVVVLGGGGLLGAEHGAHIALHHVDQAVGPVQFGIDQQRVQIAVQAGGLQVPVDQQHPVATAG